MFTELMCPQVQVLQPLGHQPKNLYILTPSPPLKESFNLNIKFENCKFLFSNLQFFLPENTSLGSWLGAVRGADQTTLPPVRFILRKPCNVISSEKIPPNPVLFHSADMSACSAGLPWLSQTFNVTKDSRRFSLSKQHFTT